MAGRPGNEARFASALEECCRRVQKGESLEQCLADYPLEYRENLGRLVPLTARLGELGSDPSPEFQARLERCLLASMEEARQHRPHGLAERIRRSVVAFPALLSPRQFPMRALAIALAALLILVGSGIGVVQASEDTLPDSPLYQVKVAREWVEVNTARDQEVRLGVHIRQIGKRGLELNNAVRSGKPRRVVGALSLRLGASTVQMVDQALELQSRGRPQPAISALNVIRAMQVRVDQLLAQATPHGRPPLRRLRSFLNEQERRLTAGQ